MIPGTFCKSFSEQSELAEAIKVARGETPADLLIRNIQVLDVFQGCFTLNDIVIFRGRIVALGSDYQAQEIIDGSGQFAVPGFIDSHCHIESSLMTPQNFAQMVLPLGTTTAIWDPHEIANVWGLEGINWALEQSEHLGMDVFIMVPSCVPATDPSLGFETSGANLGPEDLSPFSSHPRVLGLAEMMAYPSVVNGEHKTLQKLCDFYGMPRDGHAPSLKGKALNAYATAGMVSCHESTALDEAREKLTKGIQVLIREGSCAKDAEKLIPILSPYTSAVVGLCSDDRNPKDIEESGHINAIINMALKQNIAPEVVFRSASYAPAMLYGLRDRGVIAPGYLADICIVSPQAGDWKKGFSCSKVLKNGVLINKGNSPQTQQLDSLQKPHKKNIALQAITKDMLRLPYPEGNIAHVRTIGLRPGQILTDHLKVQLEAMDGVLVPDLGQDVIKICVFERHHEKLNYYTVGFVKGFGLKDAAIASSINHDSHNVIAVGASDELIMKSINKLIDLDGGIVVTHSDGTQAALQLEIAGLMTATPPSRIAAQLRTLKDLAKKGGCNLEEPFLQLSFLALPVIPSLKITDRGLVDGEKFCLVDHIIK